MTYFPLTDDDAKAIGEVAEAGARLRRILAWEGGHYLVEHACGAGRYRAVAIPERVAVPYRAWLAANCGGEQTIPVVHPITLDLTPRSGPGQSGMGMWETAWPAPT
ncbi:MULTISPECIES: hypothetical protein [unclassified Nocardiopsis]|uniref:hypothetical protein n=1 Tax=unclassified Nocardiopsis TaxID=2649073 RepID=UPI001F5BD301|nr:hypothetical protein [Nocardiopsis sp. TSRI0078]